MTTELTAWFNEHVARGSLIRFAVAGGFNSLVFFVAWHGLLVIFSDTDVRFLWAVCWGATGVLAHFVHRWFTFDKRKSVRWTLPTSIPVYGTSLVGSSITIGWRSSVAPGQLRLMGIVNLLAWGVVIWLLMRLFVFQFTTTTHASQGHPAE